MMHNIKFLLFTILILLPVEAISREGYQKLGEHVGKSFENFDYELPDGSTENTSKHQGKWMLIEFGGTWCPPSEMVAEIFSELVTEIGSEKLVYLHLLDDPSWEHIRLNNFSTPGKFLGRIDDTDDLPEMYHVGFIPSIYLVNPQGKIVSTAVTLDETQARKFLYAELSDDLNLKPDFLNSPTKRILLQKALFHYNNEHYQEAKEALEEYDKEYKLTPYYYDLYTQILLHTDGWEKGLNHVDSAIQSGQLSFDHQMDAIKLKLLMRLRNSYNVPRAKFYYEDLKKRYPEYPHLQAIDSAWSPANTQLSEEATYQLAEYALRYYDYPAMRAALIPLSQHNRAEASEKLAGMLSKLMKENSVLIQSYLLNGETTKAQSLIKSEINNPIVNSSDTGLLWKAAMFNMLSGDWENVKTASSSLKSLAPGLPFSHISWVVYGLRMDNPVIVSEGIESLKSLQTQDPAYQYVQNIMNNNAEYDENKFYEIPDVGYHYLASIWLSAYFESIGKKETAVKILQDFISRNDFENHNLPYVYLYQKQLLP